MKVVTTKEIYELDKKMVEEYGIDSQILMENAAISVVNFLDKKFLDLKNKKVLVVCGSGNNGGDGFCIARKLHSLNVVVKVFIIKEEKLKGDAKLNYERIKKLKIEIIKDFDRLKDEIKENDIIIDAIFGTGLNREIEDKIKEIIQNINSSKKYILSVDLPSGINSDTAHEMGISVKADATVTFGLPKLGNLLLPGFERCGELIVSNISYPPEIYREIKIETNDPVSLPERKKSFHKKNFGDILFIAGSKKYIGAPYFSSYSFLKCGGGYSRLATVESIVPYLSIKAKEVVYYGLKETEDGTISKENLEVLKEIVNGVDMVIIGPGIGLNRETDDLILNLIDYIEKPLLIDGDGLTIIKDQLNLIKERRNITILTPHMGEFMRLFKIDKEAIEKDKISILLESSKKFNSIIVFKGFHSLIAYPDGSLFINLSGNPGLAKAGTGDVLNGVIAGMFGLGFDIKVAVRMGVFMHGFTADILKKEKGEDGYCATDLVDYLPKALKIFRENYETILKNYTLETIV